MGLFISGGGGVKNRACHEVWQTSQHMYKSESELSIDPYVLRGKSIDVDHRAFSKNKMPLPYNRIPIFVRLGG